MKKTVRRWLLWAAMLPLVLVLLLQLYFFLQILWWKQFNPESTRFMDRQLAVLREKDPKAQLKHRWVPYEQISPHLKRAVIASEDANFVAHDGIEWSAVQRAFERNQKRGKVVVGGSTITQQLAKNLFLSGERSYVRKAQEAVIATMLEALLSKDRIFEIYLNVAEWGVGVFGAEAAGRHYFGVSAANLTRYQAARLAVMLPNPRYYERHRGSTYLARRTEVILRRMRAVEVP